MAMDALRHDVFVFVNGVYQNRSYTLLNRTVKFHQAPQAGDEIVIKLDDSLITHQGDGVTVVFPTGITTNTQHWHDFMQKVWTHRENPTVKDVLERLQVVITLVDPDDNQT